MGADGLARALCRLDTVISKRVAKLSQAHTSRPQLGSGMRRKDLGVSVKELRYRDRVYLVKGRAMRFCFWRLTRNIHAFPHLPH